eukprot:6039937-Pyramimonas_sp.AAC.1
MGVSRAAVAQLRRIGDLLTQVTQTQVQALQHPAWSCTQARVSAKLALQDPARSGALADPRLLFALAPVP